MLLVCLVFVATETASAGELRGNVCDFGTQPVGSLLQQTFIMTNSSSAAQEIADVRPSCDCVTVLSFPVKVAAGETAPMRVLFKPDKLGDVRYEISAYTDGNAEPVGNFVLEAHVVEATLPNDTGIVDDVAGDLLTRRVYTTSPNRYVLAETVRRRLKHRGDMVLVDVRNEPAFKAVHIPGALHIPLYSVRTKQFLRNKTIVLVNEGYGRSALEMACEELERSGFKSVSILRGGLNAWRRAGGPLDGQPRAIVHTAHMSPQAFHEARCMNDWVIIDADTIPSDDLDLLLPPHRKVPFVEADPSYADRISALVEKNDRSSPVLILTSDGQRYEDIEQSLEAVDADIFYLEDGVEGYVRFLKKSTKMRNRKTKTVGSKGCAGCPG
jgi:rhodanese-related sulfurtransferase